MALSLLFTRLPLPSCVQWDSDSARTVASPLQISFCRLMSSVGVNAFDSHSLSHADPLSTVVFLIPVDRKVFFSGCLPSLCVRDRHISCAVCVCIRVYTDARRRVHSVFVSMYVCMYERYFSEAEAAFMSVPSVENGSASEGQPYWLHWASNSVPESQTPLSDAGSLLFVHENTTENIFGLWDWPRDLSSYYHVEMNKNLVVCIFAIKHCH